MEIWSNFQKALTQRERRILGIFYMSLPCPILYLLSCGQIGWILTYDIPSIRRSLLVRPSTSSLIAADSRTVRADSIAKDSKPSLLLPIVLPLLDRWLIQGSCRKTISRHKASYWSSHILLMPVSNQSLFTHVYFSFCNKNIGLNAIFLLRGYP